MLSKRITTAEAAVIIRSSPLFVRVAMQRGLLPIGIAMKMPGSKHWTYNISPKMLEEYTGRDVEKELEIIRSANANQH